MIYDDQDRISVRNAVLAVTTLAWVLIWLRSISIPGFSVPRVHHHSISHSAVQASATVDWLLMLAAMMAPVLIQPIQFVRGSSLVQRRTRSTLLFVAGYTAVWMFAGALMLLLAAELGGCGVPPGLGVAGAFLIAFTWQCSPAKQTCLNRCHRLRALAVFGSAADTDALVFGATQGVWCVGSCWAWMLLVVVSSWHIVAMAAITILIFCERLDDPTAVSWHWHGFGRARRIVAGRLKILSRGNAEA